VLLLVFLGAVYNFLGAVYNGHLKFEWDELRYASVLGRIGIAWGVVAILVMRLDVRGQALALVGVIAGYWALLRFGHAPDFEPGDLTIKGNVVSHFDRLFLPGKLHQSDLHDPEGLLSTIGAVGTGLIGALAGWWLKGHKQNGGVKAAGLFIAGALATGAGLIWASMGDLPLNKNLWTSSFVLLTGGLSLALLGLFYLLIDVWRLKPLFFFFTVIGMNSITIYLLEGCCPPIFEESAADYQRVLMTTAVITVEWLLLFFLYRKKVFLRV
jgi:predicted acyltransferase